MHSIGSWFFPGGLSEDIFGDSHSGRIRLNDDLNKHLLTKKMKEYITWHEQTHKFYDGYQSDKNWLKYKRGLSWIYTISGILFAGMIVNPNYTSSRSFYLRKINVVLFAWIGYSWGR